MAERYVLVVAHNYPPVYGAGAEPTLQFVAHLPRFGYRPVVLTTSRYGSLPDDDEQLRYRAADLVHTLFSPLRRGKAQGVPQAEQYRVATIGNQSRLARLRDGLMVPDTKIGWLPAATRRGRELIARYRPVAIFSTSPPETDHLVATRLQAGSGLPWVADLRDGWLFEPPNAAVRSGARRRRLEARLERRMVGTAAAIITATDPITADLCARYPAAARKIQTITNGYDRAEFAGLRRNRQPDGAFHLVYTGSLSASRQGTSAEPFFAALASLRHSHPELSIQVEMVGQIGEEERAAAQRQGLGRVVTFLPPVSRREAHQRQLDADALLLITAPGQRSVATLKLFDYIGAGAPIFALAEDNAAAAIVRQYGLGVTAPPDDAAAIATALAALVQGRPGGPSLERYAEAQERFEWRALAAQLAAVFDRVATPG